MSDFGPEATMLFPEVDDGTDAKLGTGVASARCLISCAFRTAVVLKVADAAVCLRRRRLAIQFQASFT